MFVSCAAPTWEADRIPGDHNSLLYVPLDFQR